MTIVRVKKFAPCANELSMVILAILGYLAATTFFYLLLIKSAPVWEETSVGQPVLTVVSDSNESTARAA